MNKNWTGRKPGTNERGSEDKRRELARKEEYEMACSNLEYVGDPYDSMDLGDKKIHGISLYYQLIKVYIIN
jgi:hypothetical protein